MRTASAVRMTPRKRVVNMVFSLRRGAVGAPVARCLLEGVDSSSIKEPRG